MLKISSQLHFLKCCANSFSFLHSARLTHANYKERKQLKDLREDRGGTED